MNLAGQIDKLVERGFSEERAETIVLMREAAILLFDAFPEMLVVVGGANLVLFQEGVRHSADLDFFPVAGELPEIASLKEVLSNGLKPLGELLKLGPLNLDTIHADPGEVKMMLPMDLMDRGATLKGNLKNHLEDVLYGEFESDRILKRINQVDARRCQAELKDKLPETVYKKLEQADFQPIRDALLRLFDEWL